MAEYRPLISSISAQTNDIEDKRRHKIKTIDKPNTRKRAAEESEHFESKISREAAKIIQLKVSQEAANVQLKDDIITLESKIEKQDRVLINAANEIEHLKTEYQKEIRQREDTVNTVITSRKICNVLEEHFGRVARTLTRCQNESKFLSEYYQRVVEEISSKEEKHKANEESYLVQIEVLRQNLNQSNDTKQKLSESWSDNKKTLEVLIEELRAKNTSKDEEFAKLKADLESLSSQHKVLTAEAASFKCEINQKSDIVQNLQNKLKSANKQHADEINIAGQFVGKYKEEISNLTEEVKRTKEAVCHQEDFISNLSKENLELADKLAQVEELNKDGRAKLAQMEDSKELPNEYDGWMLQCILVFAERSRYVPRKPKKLETELQSFLNEFNNVKQINKELKTSNEETKQLIYNLEAEKEQLQCNLNKEIDQCNSKQKVWFLSRAEMEDKMKILLDQNEELSKIVKEHLKAIEIGKQQNIDLQNEMKKMKNDIEAQINETVKDKVVDLVSEMKTLADTRYKLERNVDVLKRDLESSKQKEKDIAEKHEMAIITIDDLEQNIREQMKRETIFVDEKGYLTAQSKKLKEMVDRINADLKTAMEKHEEDKKQISLLNEELKEAKKMSASSFTFDKPMSLKSPINTNINLTKRIPSPPLTPLRQLNKSTQNSNATQPPISSQYKENHSGMPRTINIPKYMDDHGLFSDSSLDSCSSYIPRAADLAEDHKFKNDLKGRNIHVSNNTKVLLKKKSQPKTTHTKKIDNSNEVTEMSNIDMKKPKFFRNKRLTRNE